jgi:hypothetical protein
MSLAFDVCVKGQTNANGQTLGLGRGCLFGD